MEVVDVSVKADLQDLVLVFVNDVTQDRGGVVVGPHRVRWWWWWWWFSDGLI